MLKQPPCIATLMTSFILVGPCPVSAQSTGIQLGMGTDLWVTGGGSHSASFGIYHDHQIHSKASIHLAAVANGWALAGNDEKASRELIPGASLQLAPTLMVQPGIFLRAGAEWGTYWPANGTIEATGNPTYLNGLIGAGLQSAKWELGLALNKNLMRPETDHPYMGVKLTLSRALFVSARRFPATRQWRKPLLPWQEPRWSDRSRNWRTKAS